MNLTLPNGASCAKKARAMARRKLASSCPICWARLHDFTVRAGLNEIEARLL